MESARKNAKAILSDGRFAGESGPLLVTCINAPFYITSSFIILILIIPAAYEVCRRGI